MFLSLAATVSIVAAVFIGSTTRVLSTTEVVTKSPLWRWCDTMFPAFTTEQMDTCLVDFALVEAMDEGGELALSDCRKRFARRRWNCSDITVFSGTHFWLNDNTKEAGYVQAMRAAGLTLQVAHQCSLGHINCECEPTSYRTSESIFIMEGCPQKIDAAARKVKRFLASELRLEADAAEMERHNIFVGISAVRDSQERHCHCHGASASCAVKTCWNYLPPSTAAFDLVHARFENAEQAQMTDNGLVSVADNFRISRSAIAFLNKSLSREEFCEQELSKDRPCWTEATQSNSTKSVEGLCENLCCDRGWSVVERKLLCNCAFKAPASVICQNCTTRVRRCN